MKNKMLNAALWYGNHNYYIFPLHEAIFDGDVVVGCSCEEYRHSSVCKDDHPHLYLGPDGKCDNPGKCPRIRWKDRATTDAEQIRRWWAKWPNANIGINCGLSRILVLDADTYKDVYGDIGEMLTMEEQETVTSLTGGGGEHLIYRMAEGDHYGNATGKLPDGIDIRGHGGYIVAPPSIHKTGRSYRFEDGYGLHEIEPQPIPQALRDILDAAQSDSTVAVFSNDLEKPDLSQWRLSGRAVELIYDGQNTGDRSSTDQSVISALLKAGASDDEVKAVFTHYPVGTDGKYADRGDGYLAHSIGRARTYLNGSLSAHANDSLSPVPVASDGETPPIDALQYRAEDGGIQDAWLETQSDQWIYATGPDAWFRWNGTHWQKDDELRARQSIHNLIDTMNRQCSIIKTEMPKKIADLSRSFVGIDMPDSVAEQIEEMKKRIGMAEAMRKATKRSNGRISSVEGMAQASLAKSITQFDANDTLNLRNGTLNLHSLELLPHEPADLITYQLDYDFDPEAKCPRWESFMREVLVKEGTEEADFDLISLFQEMVGYSLTTQVKYQTMIWMFGEGSNGKSVAIDVVSALIGTLATTVDFQSIGMPGNYDLADIPGKRIVFSTEAERGGSMAESYIKRIVSGDALKARPIYGSPIEFRSSAKIWWSMNDKPVIKDTSDSMWRRMKMVPFHRKFEEGRNADPDLTAKLLAELSGVLNWGIRGLIRLIVNGKFTASEAADQAKMQYREESNPVARWVNSNTVPTEFPATLQSAMFERFKAWMNSENERSITSQQFGRDLKRLKLDSTRRAAGQMYHLALIDTADVLRNV